MKAKILKTISAFCVTAIMATSLAACGGSTNSSKSGGSTQEAKKEPPMKVSIATIHFSPNPPALEGTPILKRLNELTNAELDIKWIQSSGYQEKLNVSIAAGEMSDITLLLEHKNSMTINSFINGVFWEIGPQLSKYKNLAAMDKDVMNNVSIEGKIYSIPRNRPTVRMGLTVRKDWMDALGIKEIKTPDDIYNTLKAFTLNDPDKNGKNDTLGVALTETSYRYIDATLQTVLAIMGGGNQYELKNGKLTPVWLTNEYVDALNFLKKLYDEKLINQDFTVTKSATAQQKFEKGETGMVIGASNTENWIKKAEENNPKARGLTVYTVNGKNGAKMAASDGFYGEYAINKKVDEKKMLKCLEVLNALAGQEAYDICYYGLKDEHYTETPEGAFTINPEQEKKFKEERPSDLTALALHDKVTPNLKNRTPKPAAEDAAWKHFQYEFVKKTTEEAPKLAVFNPIAPLVSQTDAEKSATLNKIVYDNTAKYILGNINLDEFKKEMERWKKEGGDKIIEEYNAAHQKSVKK